MATMQQTRPKTGTDLWSSMSMMPNPTVSKEQSEAFVKKLIALGVSNVTFLRAVFPEKAYVDRELEGIRLKILRANNSSPAVDTVIKWLKSAFDAISKNYLRQLILAIHEEGKSPDEVLETYTFHFTYKDENVNGCTLGRKINETNENVVSEVGCSVGEIRKNTLLMLRTTIQLTQSLPILPEKCGISMKLLYYDDVTPEDYEPQGFYSVETSSYEFPSDTSNCKLGFVKTPYHTVKLNAKLENQKLKELDKEQMSPESSQGTDITMNSTRNNKVQEESNILSEGNMSPRVDDVFCTSMEADTDILSLRPKSTTLGDVARQILKQSENCDMISAKDAEELVKMHTPPEVKKDGVRCACGIAKDGGLMVQCEYCKHWQHGPCYGLLRKADLPRFHCCDVCHHPKHECTDTNLLKLSEEQKKEVCLYRRTLIHITLSRVSASIICKGLDVSSDIANLLMELLEEDGVIRPSRSKIMPRSVNSQVLNTIVMPRYFGPKADLSSHKYKLNADDLLDCSTKAVKNLTLAPKENGKQKRMFSKKIMIEDEEEPSPRKRQRGSQSDQIFQLAAKTV